MSRRGRPFRRRRGGTKPAGVTYLTTPYDDPDWTFTRTGEASFWDPRSSQFAATGAGAWLAANVPRLFSDGAVLLEESRRNTFIESSDLASVTLLNSPTITSDDGTAPDGSGADLVEFAAGGGLGQVRELMSDTFFTDGATSVVSGFFLDPDNEDVEFLFRDKALVNDFTGAQAMPTSWGRLTADVNNGTGSADPLLAIYESTDGADFHAWGLQCEQGAFPSSPIRTTGAAVVRSPDRLSLTAANGADDALAAALDSGLALDFWPTWGSSDPALNNATLFTWGANRLRVYRQGTSGSSWALAVGGAVTGSTVTITHSPQDHMRCKVTKSGTDWTLTMENLTQGTSSSSTSSTVLTPGTGHSLFIGNYASGSFDMSAVYGRMKQA